MFFITVSFMESIKTNLIFDLQNYKVTLLISKLVEHKNNTSKIT